MTQTPQDRTAATRAHQRQPDLATSPPPAVRLEHVELPTPAYGVPRWEPEEGDFS